MGEVKRESLPVVAPEFRVSRSATTRVPAPGTRVMEMAMATFDPSANTSQRAIAAHGLAVHIPDNAVVTRVFIDVITTFTDGDTDAATIAVHLQSANDVVAAIAISDASNVWDAGIRGSKIGYPNYGADAAHDSAVEVAALHAASYLKMTAEREVTVTVAGVALTAGKANIFVEYFLSA